METSKDPLKSGAKTSEMVVTGIVAAIIPLVDHFGTLDAHAQTLMVVIAAVYIVSRTAPKTAKAFGQGKSESGVFWKREYERLNRRWNKWADEAAQKGVENPADRPK